MAPHRKLLLALTVLLVGGSLSWTAAYGLHLRSEANRVEVEGNLSAFFELPCNVGRIRGDTFTSRAFEDVEVWLPDRRDRVFHCEEAIWRESHRGGTAWNELDLIRGVLLLGTDRWRNEDYRQVFQSGLGHDFEDLDLREVSLEDFEIAFDRHEVSVRCSSTSGRIDMTDPTDGIAHLIAYELNGYQVGQGVRIDARFLPKNGVEVSEFVLTLPEVPLAAIGLDTALGTEITTGRFAGRIQYCKTPDGHELWLDGVLHDTDLAELTHTFALGPVHGRFSMTVNGARISGSVITHFRGSGAISELSLSGFGPLFGVPTFSGTASFNLDVIDLALGHVNRLRMDGVITGLLLDEWLGLFGRGSATGSMVIRVNNLDIVDDNMKSADIEITVLPPEGEAGTIDRTLLLTAAERATGFTWPEAVPQDILPEHVEYAEFGVRLLVRDNRLRILGTHGKDGDTILTIRLWGKPFPILHERPDTIDLQPHIHGLVARARSYDPAEVRDWWESRLRRGSDGGSVEPIREETETPGPPEEP
ncbi:MAG: hypothetical protein ABII12_10840 [Planctomycetota bacterium]